MKTWVTRFDDELLGKAKHFLDAAAAQPESRKVLEQFGFGAEEQQRGLTLVANAERAFQWEREGRAWNFLSPTPERRIEEARAWYKETRRRWMNDSFRKFEEARGVFAKLSAVADWMSREAREAHQAELQRDLERARGDKPADAPPPKDTALVELQGWYERWRLLAQRVFRERPDMMSPYGLTPGKAPPRLRGKLARLKYGEGAAGKLDGQPAAANSEEDGDGEAEPLRALPVVR